MTIFALFGLPNNLLDVGSGIGSMVRLARALGVDAIGVDILAEPPDIYHDLTTPLVLQRRFDMVISLETAEHLPAEAAGVFCDTIAQHKDVGATLVFSAARPGQGGIDHVNLQSQAYWRKALAIRGWNYDPHRSTVLANLLRQTSGPAAHWLPHNVQVFS